MQLPTHALVYYTWGMGSHCRHSCFSQQTPLLPHTMQHESGAPTIRLSNPVLLGLDRQIQTRTGI